MRIDQFEVLGCTHKSTTVKVVENISSSDDTEEGTRHNRYICEQPGAKFKKPDRIFTDNTGRLQVVPTGLGIRLICPFEECPLYIKNKVTNQKNLQ